MYRPVSPTSSSSKDSAEARGGGPGGVFGCGTGGRAKFLALIMVSSTIKAAQTHKILSKSKGSLNKGSIKLQNRINRKVTEIEKVTTDPLRWICVGAPGYAFGNIGKVGGGGGGTGGQISTSSLATWNSRSCQGNKKNHKQVHKGQLLLKSPCIN